MAALTDASSWGCHSGNSRNDVKLCFVEEDDLLAKVTCNAIEYSISSRLWRVVILSCIRIQSKGLKLGVKWWGKAVEIVLVDLEWPREVKHNVDTDLSKPYRRNVNNRELNHVWISSYSLLCKRYGSSFLLKKDWFLYYCLFSLQRLIGNGLYL